MFKIRVWFWSMGLFFLLTYCAFISWNMAVSNPAYIRLLETFLPGFKWLSPMRLVLGAAESFLYGAYVAIVFVPIHNFYYRRHHPQTNVTRDKAAA